MATGTRHSERTHSRTVFLVSQLCLLFDPVQICLALQSGHPSLKAQPVWTNRS